MRSLTGVVLLVTLSGCGAGAEEREVEPRAEVETAVVERVSLPVVLEVTGHLRPAPDRSALLTAPAPGVIGSIHGQVGTVVTAGTTLIELLAPELSATARQLSAEADLAAREATRTETLFGQGIVARKDVERAAAAQVSTRAAADAARRLAERATVKSPLDGVIQKVVVQTGERVEAGAPLVEILDPAVLDLVGAVPAGVLSRLQRGQAASLVAGADTVIGVVRGVAPGVDSVTETGDVVIRVTNRARRFRPGQSATATVKTGRAEDVLAVPVEAVVLVGGVTTVFVVGADSVAHAEPVTTGIRSGGVVEVRGRLAAGDRVVTVGAYGLTDGARVTAVAAKPE